MRKWMRDRLTRRKKTPAETSDQPAPPPLQPAYFDAEQQPSAAPDSGDTESETSVPHEAVAETRPARRPRSSAVELPPDRPVDQSGDDQPSEAQPAPQDSASKRTSNTGRGRRRRGGRGRG